MCKRNRYSHVTIHALLAGLTGLGLALHLEAGALYKWVDENGQIRYSDRLPPDQSKKQHQQLNSQGVVVTTKEAAKSDEERAIAAEARRVAEKKLAEETRLKQTQDKKDQVLLLTFSSEAELSQVKDDRVEVIDSVIRLINKSIVSNQEKLDKFQSLADANYISQGKEVPGGLAQKIEHFSRQIANRNTQLNLKQQERDKITRQFELDLARFRDLKSQ